MTQGGERGRGRRGQTAAPEGERDLEEDRFDPYKPTTGNSDDVRAMIGSAEEENVLAELGDGDPLPGQKLDGIEPGRWHADELGLPPDFPVLPLGTEDGVYYFLDTIGQMRAMKGSELGQAGINELFMGRHLYLYWAFPKITASGDINGWRAEKAREVLMAACARKGAWSSADRVRGRGMWTNRKGQLLLHCGDRLISGEHDMPLGELEGMVYPTRPPLIRPWSTALRASPGPALVLLPHLRTWNWRRPQLDPILLIGWIGTGFLGGALDWRSHVFVQGDKATGKSSLQNDIKKIMGPWVVNSGDTTAAGLYQKLKHDCLAVAIDEFEAKADTRKQKAVIELGRLSSSGAPMNRGGDNHKGTEFYGRSAFLFSSINSPPMEPQDLSRQAILALNRLPEGSVRPVIAAGELERLGQKILRKLIESWHRWPATFAAWREFLASIGHDGRGQDTFGTLMAVADLVIDIDAHALDLEMATAAYDGFDSWREVLAAEYLAEYEDQAANWRLCLNHIMSKRIEAWRGGTRHTVGEVLTEFFESAQGDGAITFDQARGLLEQTGLALLRPEDRSPNFELFVPNQHTLLYELFKDSKWQGELGAGSWSGALRQAEDMCRDASARIHGVKKRGVAFRLADIIDKDERAEKAA